MRQRAYSGVEDGVGDGGTFMNVADLNCVAGFPKTTKLTNICLHPVCYAHARRYVVVRGAA